MRKTSFAVVTFGLLSLGGGLAAGCGNRATTCEDNLNCGNGGSGAGSSSSSSGGTAGNGGTGGGGNNPGCDGDPTTKADIVSNECGVFVSASAAAGGDGSKEKPFNKLSAAVTEASNKNRNVYACAEGYAETLTLVVNDSLGIYGGFTCAGGAWAWDATKRAVLTGPEEQMAMRLKSNAGTIHVENLDVVSPNATKTKGASSIAVYVNSGTVEFKSCDLTAGDAMPGDDGMNAPVAAATDGTNGNNGANACLAATQNGAPQLVNSCGNPDSIGGKGGDGNLSNGGSGQAGLPNNGGGQFGAGDDGTAGWTCAGKGGKGSDGLPGDDGSEGPGALSSDFGTLTTNGFVGASGVSGMPGLPGQGGGGGGGVRGGALCTTAGKPGTGGASGGSGGSGGCGGLGGGGGKGGGSSIALVSANAKVTLTSVKLAAGTGGKGGKGGDFQGGGAGSNGGNGGTNSLVGGLAAGCNGGPGGAGGSGGPGGGGRGGHSLGIASTGTPPQIDAANVTIKAPGAGGPGGTGNIKTNQGADGTANACVDFMTGLACP